MGKGWKKASMLAQAQKKGAQFTKMAREITVAARLGGPDPDANSRLRMAIDAARAVSCPKDTIERAIKKGSGQLEGGVIEEVTYEGYGPHQVGIIVECQTDNRNRTASEIRNIFKKHNGNMGETGSATWMFDRVAYLEAEPSDKVEDIEAIAIEVEANEVEAIEPGKYAFYGIAEDLDAIRNALGNLRWDVTAAELSYKAKTPATDLTAEQKREVVHLLEALDNNEDSHRIHTTAEELDLEEDSN